MVKVGGRGGDSTSSRAGAGGTGGTNGGNGATINNEGVSSAGGGGASDVRRGGSGLANRVIVGAGGVAQGLTALVRSRVVAPVADRFRRYAGRRR